LYYIPRKEIGWIEKEGRKETRRKKEREID